MTIISGPGHSAENMEIYKGTECLCKQMYMRRMKSIWSQAMKVVTYLIPELKARIAYVHSLLPESVSDASVLQIESQFKSWWRLNGPEKPEQPDIL